MEKLSPTTGECNCDALRNLRLDKGRVCWTQIQASHNDDINRVPAGLTITYQRDGNDIGCAVTFVDWAGSENVDSTFCFSCWCDGDDPEVWFVMDAADVVRL